MSDTVQHNNPMIALCGGINLLHKYLLKRPEFTDECFEPLKEGYIEG